MNFVMDLPPEVEDRLQKEAKRQGVPAADVALRLIEHGIATALKPNPNDLPYEEWLERFNKIVQRPANPNMPVITPEMMRRVNIYAEDEDEE